MPLFSNFAISFSIICILAGGITSFQLGFSSTGGFSIGVGWLIGSVFAVIVACSMAQIASAYPTAGGLYHWSSILGGRGWGWATAWINLLGLIFVVASVDVGVYLLFTQLILTNIFHIDVSHWGLMQQAIGVILITASQALFNHFGIRVTTKLTDFSGYLILVTAVVLTIAMLYAAPSIHISRLFTFVNNTGDAGGGVFPTHTGPLMALLLGLILPLYTITGFDASAHTSEETVDAQRTVPKGMIHAVVWSGLFGYIMACSFVLAMPDMTKAAKDGGNVFFNLLGGLPIAIWLKYLIFVAIVLANYLCALAGVTSTSRMLFAFARDGGLPFSNTLKRVNPHYRTPVPAIWTVAMPVFAGLLAEGRSWTDFGPFRLGVLSKPFAVITVVGGIILLYIGTRPPNDILDSYAIGALVLLVIGWFALERRRFKGPPIGDAAIRARQAAILAEERALEAEA
jgi:amino acid transporter